MGVPPVEESLSIGIDAVKIAKGLGLKVMVLGSTDLTHYGVNYGFVSHGTGAQAVKWVKNENDKRVIDAMLEMNPVKVIKRLCQMTTPAARVPRQPLSARQRSSDPPAPNW